MNITAEKNAVPQVYGAINGVATELAAPKNRVNGFSKYKYRDLSSLRNALKPLLAKYNLLVLPTATKEFQNENDVLTMTLRIVSIQDGSEVSSSLSVNCDQHKGMSAEQASGSALTYAEKYLLCMVFHVDDDSDESDPDNEKVQTSDIVANRNLLKEACDALKVAANNDVISDIVKRYRELWDNSDFKKAVQEKRNYFNNK